MSPGQLNKKPAGGEIGRARKIFDHAKERRYGRQKKMLVAGAVMFVMLSFSSTGTGGL